MFSWIEYTVRINPRWNLPESQTSHPGVLNAALTPSTMLKSSVRSFVFLFGKERKRKKKERNEESSSAAGLVKQDLDLALVGSWWFMEKLDRFSIRWEWKSIFFFFFLKKEFFSKVFVFVSLRIFSNGNSASWSTPVTISWPTIRLYDGRHPDCGQPVVANAHFL